MSESKYIFITGAASGIGRATANRFASQGWRVGAADLDEAGLASLGSELGGDAYSAYPLDVTNAEMFDAVIAEFADWSGGRLDVLYNNAGIGISGYFEDIPLERSLDIVNVNLVGVIHGIYAALPLLKRTPNSLCFSTSSSAATYGAASLAVYAATKFAVKGLTEALAVELSRHDVRVADVLPGLIDTPILNCDRYVDGKVTSQEGERSIGANIPDEGMFRLIQPSEVAEAVWNAYHEDKLHWYVPAEIEEIDLEKVKSPEAMRDGRIEMLKLMLDA
ncbi:MAG: SDR family oxidoreductase [Deltaproteobacteria bacterium]|nr:SDR family oxidoreductase [Deltaproteobacteria bacterium]